MYRSRISSFIGLGLPSDAPALMLFVGILSLLTASAATAEEGTCSLAELDGDSTGARQLGYDAVVAVARREEWACTGVVVSADRVLTAAHCLPATHILVGDDIRQPRDIVSVSDTVRHPEADVAVLILAEELQNISPVEVRHSVDNTMPSVLLRHVGFGSRDPQGRLGFGRKKIVDLPLSRWGCHPSEAEFRGCDPRHEMVIGAAGGLDTCTGDSGGPLLELATIDGTCSWRIVGLTSRAAAFARVACGHGGIYVRMERIQEWLSEVIEPG